MVKERKMLKVDNELLKTPARGFPTRTPSKFYLVPMMLNFRDQTRTGVFILV